FQAEDGIRDWSVTGVQTCALPISIQSGVEGRSGERRAVHEDNGRGMRTRGERRNVGKLPVIQQETAQRSAALGKGWTPNRIDGQIGRASCRERVENEGGRG